MHRLYRYLLALLVGACLASPAAAQFDHLHLQDGNGANVYVPVASIPTDFYFPSYSIGFDYTTDEWFYSFGVVDLPFSSGSTMPASQITNLGFFPHDTWVTMSASAGGFFIPWSGVATNTDLRDPRYGFIVYPLDWQATYGGIGTGTCVYETDPIFIPIGLVGGQTHSVNPVSTAQHVTPTDYHWPTVVDADPDFDPWLYGSIAPGDSAYLKIAAECLEVIAEVTGPDDPYMDPPSGIPAPSISDWSGNALRDVCTFTVDDPWLQETTLRLPPSLVVVPGGGVPAPACSNFCNSDWLIFQRCFPGSVECTEATVCYGEYVAIPASGFQPESHVMPLTGGPRFWGVPPCMSGTVRRNMVNIIDDWTDPQSQGYCWNIPVNTDLRLNNYKLVDVVDTAVFQNFWLNGTFEITVFPYLPRRDWLGDDGIHDAEDICEACENDIWFFRTSPCGECVVPTASRTFVLFETQMLSDCPGMNALAFCIQGSNYQACLTTYAPECTENRGALFVPWCGDEGPIEQAACTPVWNALTQQWFHVQTCGPVICP